MKTKRYSFIYLMLMGSVLAEPGSFLLSEAGNEIEKKDIPKFSNVNPSQRNNLKQSNTNIPLDFRHCGDTAKAQELARLISVDAEQLRPIIKCNSKLSRIAAEKAKEMAEQGEVSHQGTKFGPNERLLQSGYRLTINEKEQYNSVEALLGGEEDAEETLFKFKMSYGHKIHLLGEHPFYLNQTQLGVGYHQKWHSPHIDYWVVYFAETEAPETSSEPLSTVIIKDEK